MVEVTRKKLKNLNYRFLVKSGHYYRLYNLVMGDKWAGMCIIKKAEL